MERSLGTQLGKGLGRPRAEGGRPVAGKGPYENALAAFRICVGPWLRDPAPACPASLADARAVFLPQAMSTDRSLQTGGATIGTHEFEDSATPARSRLGTQLGVRPGVHAERHQRRQRSHSAGGRCGCWRPTIRAPFAP